MKKIYKQFLYLFIFFFLGSSNLFSQINLAPSATPTCTTTQGGTTSGGGWNWTQINDGVNSACNTQEAFIWTQNPPASTDEMVWTWTSVKSINKIVFHNANATSRNMTGCDVYYWNGSTYAYWATIAIKQQCLDSATFATVTTSRLKLTNIRMTGTGQTSNPNWREIQIISGPSVNHDAGVAGTTDFNLCNNSQPLTARIFNFGKIKIDSVDLNWSLNGNLQSPIKVYANLASAKDTTIVINPNFSFTNSTTYNFKFWTSLPNGNLDSIDANDTLNYVLNFMGNPTPPTTNSYTQCGNGRPTLSATPNNSADSVLWYEQSSGGPILGIGKSIQDLLSLPLKPFMQ
ncbi:MAG: hypothetical protein R2852_04170 [Bacteroidia bacterium]